MPITIKRTEEVKAAVYGGSFLGGGGGGSIEEGLELGLAALRLGEIKIYNVEELPSSTVVVTVSAVGAPAAEGAKLEPEHLVRAVELLREAGVEVGALMAAENGGFNTVNGWYQSVTLSIPLLNAACDGRAHPTGVMGAMGLHKVEGYTSLQAAAGGDVSSGRYVEVVVKSSLPKAASVIRTAAAEAGIVGVARNPVELSYVIKKAAVGAIKLAMDVGFKLLKGVGEGDARSAAEEVSSALGGGVVDEVSITEKQLVTRRGFDVGFLKLVGAKGEYRISFLNEYMTLEKGNERIATFPDLIVLMDASNGKPITSAEASVGANALLVVIPRSELLLGAGLLYRDVYGPVEEALRKRITPFIKDILLD